MTSMMETLEARRMLSDAGQLDTTFDGDGRSPQSFSTGQLIGIQPGGKIVLQRTDVGGFRLARVNSNGSIDNTFLGGQTLTEIPGTAYFDVSPTDGRIAYVAATSKNTETQIGVFKADGSPDNSFDTDGKEVLTLGYAASQVAWQGGKLVVFGGPIDNNTGQYNKATLIRLNSDGTQDSTFGTGGKATLSSTPNTLNGIKILSDNSILTSVDYYTYTNDYYRDLRVNKFTANGKPDTTFGQGAGYIDATSGNDYNLRTLAFQATSDGTSYVLHAESDGFRLRRFAPDGTISLTGPLLHMPGYPTSYFPEFPRQIGIQPDGKPLLIGTGQYSGSDLGWMSARLNVDFTYDATYGIEGASYPRVQNNGRALVQSDGKVLVSGKRFGTDGGNFEVLRLDTGTLGGGTITLNKKGTLIITGTAFAEDLGVRFRAKDGRFVAWVGTNSRAMAPSAVKRIAIFAGDGADTITVGAGVRGSYLGGEGGADTLNGGDADDVLVGGLAGDQMFGNNGNDSMVGEGGNDYILGGAGNDVIYGNGGSDTLSGAGGNDRLFGGPDAGDTVNGGAGNDSAANDTKDKYDSIETLLA